MSGVGYLAAFGGGFVSFLSPCVLPLVPAYVSMVTGLDVAELRTGDGHQVARIVRDTGLFVLGFGTVFVVLGLGANAFGGAVFRNQILLTRVSGLLVVAMALFLAASLVVRAPWLYREMRFHPSPSRLGPLAAPVTGAAFGFGWTPCIGPVLGSVLAFAGSSGHAAHAAALLARLLDRARAAVPRRRSRIGTARRRARRGSSGTRLPSRSCPQRCSACSGCCSCSTS